MKEKVGKLIGELTEAYDAEFRSQRTEAGFTGLRQSTAFLGSAISNLRSAKDNLSWREEALGKENAERETRSALGTVRPTK